MAAVALLSSTIGAAAAPVWKITGGAQQTLASAGTSLFNPAAAGNIPSDIVVGTTQVWVGGTLDLLAGATNLIYTYLGKEAGATNAGFEIGGQLFNNSGTATITVDSGPVVAATPLDFKFTTSVGGGTGGEVKNGSAGTGTSSVKPAIAFFLPTLDSRTVYAFLDDGGGTKLASCPSGDCDWDDMYVSITYVPLPAPFLLLLGAMGGLGFVSRKRKAA